MSRPPLLRKTKSVGFGCAAIPTLSLANTLTASRCGPPSYRGRCLIIWTLSRDARMLRRRRPFADRGCRDVPDEEDPVGTVQMVGVQREVAVIGGGVRSEGQLRAHTAESLCQAPRVEDAGAFRGGVECPFERAGLGGVESFIRGGSERRGQEGVLATHLRSKRPCAPPRKGLALEGSPSGGQEPLAPVLLQVKVLGEDQRGPPPRLLGGDGLQVFGHHRVALAHEPGELGGARA